MRIKLTPVESGIINEKLLVESALNNASAEIMIIKNAPIKGRFKRNKNHSDNVVNVLSFSCILIIAAPETFKAA